MSWGSYIVGKATDWDKGSSKVRMLPFSKERDNKVAFKVLVHNKGEEVQQMHKSKFKNDWDIGSVEQFDWIWLLNSSYFSGTNQKLYSEALDI